MKIIEALKNIKANKAKIVDLAAKIKANSALLSSQTSAYGDSGAATRQVGGWLDSVRQTLAETEALTRRIHKTNNSTNVTIELAGVAVTKTIDEWLVRRKDGVDLQALAYSALTDRNLKEEFVTTATGERIPVTIVRHYDAAKRDAVLSSLMSEKATIDGTLEIVNATTDLME